MGKTHVEITYSRKIGLIEILADGKELDIAQIPGRKIDDWKEGYDWFTPSTGRDGWEGLLREIQNLLADWSENFSFSFYGPPEYQQTFFQHLRECGMFIDSGPSREEQAADLFSNGKKADHHQNYKEALKYYQAAAKLGHAEAQFRAAEFLTQRKGCDSKDDTGQLLYQAATLYEQAAKQGHVNAMHRLSECYADGKGVSADQQKAAEWCRESAEQGLASDQYRLGVYYKNGFGMIQDHIKSVEWFRKAAEQGYVDALYSLGICYKDGLGVMQNHEKAAEWFRKAANRGHTNAQYRLAECYETGLGVSADEKQAAEWYRRAEEQK